jgi:acetylornithine deacetylase/succinyl-diaminopimelate desuccinylase-like protein
VTALELLQQLVHIDTTNPPGNEAEAAELLEADLRSAGLEVELFSDPDGRTSLVGRVPGPRDVPALVLLSHLDVVGVEPQRWSRDPFGAEVADGFVWGRGTLDMKGITAMHAAAAKELATSDASPTREVLVVAVADEEAGGVHGARWLVEERPGEVGFRDGLVPDVLGEGAFGLSGVLDGAVMPIVRGEKSALWIELKATGEPGHGGLPPLDQAPHKLVKAVDKVAGFSPPRVHRVMSEQFQILAENAPSPTAQLFRVLASGAGRAVALALRKQLRKRGVIGSLLSDTVTPTQIAAGYKHNVVPGEAVASLDVRLLPDTDVDDFLSTLRRKVDRLGVTVEVKSRHGGPVSDRGRLHDLLIDASRPLGLPVPSLTAGITDVRYFRAKGAAGYGWVPLVLSPELLATIHGHDERISIEDFQRAVEIMTRIVTRHCS